jgi:hypothetical protein
MWSIVKWVVTIYILFVTQSYWGQQKNEPLQFSKIGRTCVLLTCEIMNLYPSQVIKGHTHLCELQLCYDNKACHILGDCVRGAIKPLTIEPFASLATG